MIVVLAFVILMLSVIVFSGLVIGFLTFSGSILHKGQTRPESKFLQSPKQRIALGVVIVLLLLVAEGSFFFLLKTFVG